jgi:Mrp family chromosome partitioning ATPase
VDAHLGSPSLQRYFRLGNVRGLAEAILEQAPIQEFIKQVGDSNLWLLASGLTPVLLGDRAVHDHVHRRVKELRKLFRYVVINAPFDVDGVSASLRRAADGVVLVLEANRTPRETAREIMDELELSGSRVLGVVLDNCTSPVPDAFSRYL